MGESERTRIRALITGTGRYLPDAVWTSDMVEARVNEHSGVWSIPDGIIRLATGVAERRYAPDGVCSSQLATWAAKQALRDAGIDPCDIDLRSLSPIVCLRTPRPLCVTGDDAASPVPHGGGFVIDTAAQSRAGIGP